LAALGGTRNNRRNSSSSRVRQNRKMHVTAQKRDHSKVLPVWAPGNRRAREWAVLAYRLQAKGD
jgi:hypothetical protein